MSAQRWPSGRGTDLILNQGEWKKGLGKCDDNTGCSCLYLPISHTRRAVHIGLHVGGEAQSSSHELRTSAAMERAEHLRGRGRGGGEPQGRHGAGSCGRPGCQETEPARRGGKAIAEKKVETPFTSGVQSHAPAHSHRGEFNQQGHHHPTRPRLFQVSSENCICDSAEVFHIVICI